MIIDQYGNRIYETATQDGLNGWLDQIRSGLGNVASVFVSYNEQLARIKTAEAQVAAARAQGQVAQGAGQTASNLDQYMPIVLGIGGLMAVAMIAQAMKK